MRTDTTVPGARAAERSAQVKGAARRAGDTQQNALPPWRLDEHGPLLLQIARTAISNALGRAVALPEPISEAADVLQAPGASFVTLNQHGQLRGCIGSLQAHRPLIQDIQANAVAAALHDPRFTPLTLSELDITTVEVSVLSAMQPLPFTSEADALALLRPGVDGVVFEFGRYRSTFLPQVWEQLPKPRQFMAHLKQKAGLAPDFWAPGVRLQRYTVHKFKESEVSS
ncbi:MAG: AmmeMemoRadiSam system protein A [Rhodoferax sp.]|uniref:AmmeMemoRadiSam system protein A n=1 Tax=Rhodoferax sp. TaxID=50421 RepID=UPI002732181E|nr:AmmeMemoRadiSam system protein A [Rhodoferax sp.]MDP1531775.1 AmmeMemoRadiSam system protein A [Rhodoferax sp.]MDP1944331.1 AmmeMemoRadiSam system protein A [Rhodoferax sp.]